MAGWGGSGGEEQMSDIELERKVDKWIEGFLLMIGLSYNFCLFVCLLFIGRNI